MQRLTVRRHESTALLIRSWSIVLVGLLAALANATANAQSPESDPAPGVRVPPPPPKGFLIPDVPDHLLRKAEYGDPRFRVYVIPPNATLTVVDKRFHLEKRPALERHLPIDALLKSLAAAFAGDAIGVILSGGDSDGSLGIQAIRHEGGIVFAQDPDSARLATCLATLSKRDSSIGC